MTDLVLAGLLAAAAAAYEGAAPPTGPAPEIPAAPRLTKAPTVVKFVQATYPPEALAAGAGAEVALFVDIDALGHVTGVEVTRPADPAFNVAAVAALLQFEFSAAELDGTPAPVRIEYVYHFEARPPPPPEVEPAAPERPVNLKGWVRERGTREQLVGASVFLPKSGQVVESGADGLFELRGIEPGQVQVEISEQTHQKYVDTVEVKEGEVTEVTAYLWKKSDRKLEATVRGEREKREVTRRTLQKEELTSVPGTFGDPVRVIQNLPGMARAPYVMGDLLVRGSQPDDTSVLLDGVPVPLLYHFSGGPSVVSSSLIDRIDFFPGAYSAKYGRAIAGIVDVSTRSSQTKSLHGNASVDLLNAGLYLESPLVDSEKFGTLTVAARRSYLDVFLPAVLDSMRRPGETSIVATPYYWDYQGRYDLSLGRDQFSLTAFGSDDQLSVTQSGDAETQAFSLGSRQGFHRFRLAWGRTTEDGWALSLAPTVGTNVSTFKLNDESDTRTSSWDIGLRGAASKELLPGLSLEVGLDLNPSFYETRFETAQEPAPGETETPAPLVRNHNVRIAPYALYAESVWTPVSRWKIIPGLRLELYDLPGGVSTSVEPRLATRFAVTDFLTAKAAWGLFRQAPQARELDSDTGNPDLGLSQSYQSVAGFELALTPKLTVDAQGFYNWRSRLVVSSDAFVTRDGQEMAEHLQNGGRGHAYGMELLVKHDVTEHFYGWIAYTLSRSEQYDETKKKYLPVGFDQTHILTVVASYKLAGWELGARFRLTTGRPETPILGSVLNADSGGYEPITGETGETRGATFHQLDLRIEKEWTFNLWKFSAYVDVQNVYNADNPEATLWDYRYRDSAALQGLPILPTLGLKGSF